MADEPISALTLFTSYSTADEVEILDVSDTTFAATGTNKRIQFSTLLSMAGVGSGGLTSVGLSVPSWLTVSNSPLTGNGTLNVTATTGETANQFLATPSGTTGAVGLRAITTTDLPSAVVLTTGSYASPAWITSISGGIVSGNITGNAGSITGTIPESQVVNLTTDLAAKAADSSVVHLAGAETITGAKTFAANPWISGTAATNRDLDLATAGVQRWGVRCDASPETGSNAGSNFQLCSYSDAGSYQFSPISVTRSTGAVGLPISLGVGTTSPQTTVHIDTSGSAGMVDSLRLSYHNAVGSGAGITWYAGNNTTATAWLRHSLLAGVMGQFNFATFNGTSLVQHMTLDGAGDLQITGALGVNGATPPAKAASPGTAVGTDAAVINAISAILRSIGFCS